MSTKPALQSFAFDLIGQYALAQTVYAAFECGFWEHFERTPDAPLDPEAVAAARGHDKRLCRALAEHLMRRDVLVRADGGRFKLAPKGEELVKGQWLGYFVHMVGGYGGVLAQAAQLATGRVKYGHPLKRDGRAVALGSELIGRNPHHQSYAAAFERAAIGAPHTVLDLGCGSAGFLIDLVNKTGAKRGIGVDVSAEACALARLSIEKAGKTGQIDVVEADARRMLEKNPALEGGVDVVTAMFIIHEFFAADMAPAVQQLKDLARTLKPRTGRLLILDKVTDPLEGELAPGYFTEFKLVHDLTNQTLVSRKEWLGVLERAGLKLEFERVLGAHTGTILLECSRA